MKTFVPSYYEKFSCIAEKCSHTCCVGWEIDIDEASLEKYKEIPDIREKISFSDTPHFELSKDEVCPFLASSGLCDMISRYGEGMLCQICRDHPRFRNFIAGREEIGLGLVCEEAARIILSEKEPLRFVMLSDDGEISPSDPEDEEILCRRDALLRVNPYEGPSARLYEYLVFRHFADSVYDGRTEAREEFIRECHREITDAWSKTDGSLNSLVEYVIIWSYDNEYDEEETERQLSEIEKRLSKTNTTE